MPNGLAIFFKTSKRHIALLTFFHNFADSAPKVVILSLQISPFLRASFSWPKREKRRKYRKPKISFRQIEHSNISFESAPSALHFPSSQSKKPQQFLEIFFISTLRSGFHLKCYSSFISPPTILISMPISSSGPSSKKYISNSRNISSSSRS